MELSVVEPSQHNLNGPLCSIYKVNQAVGDRSTLIHPIAPSSLQTFVGVPSVHPRGAIAPENSVRHIG